MTMKVYIVELERRWFKYTFEKWVYGLYSYLVGCPGVAEQSRGEVSNVSSNLLNHHLSHLTAPDGLGCVKLTQEDLTELIRT